MNGLPRKTPLAISWRLRHGEAGRARLERFGADLLDTPLAGLPGRPRHVPSDNSTTLAGPLPCWPGHHGDSPAPPTEGFSRRDILKMSRDTPAASLGMTKLKDRPNTDR